MVPGYDKELKRCEQREKALIEEVNRTRELQVPLGDSALMLKVSDLNRLRRDAVSIRFENSRLHRENQSLIK